MRRVIITSLLSMLIACDSESDKPEGPPPADLRIGQVMVETGHRFETSGRAAAAGRWELAQYEAHEIIEVFEGDMPRALLPGDCNDELADRMFLQLRDEQLATLRAAAGERDMDAYSAAFREASASCNGCHAACEVAFVQVPAEPGREVPRLDAVSGAAAGAGPAVGEEPSATEEAADPAPADEATDEASEVSPPAADRPPRPPRPVDLAPH